MEIYALVGSSGTGKSYKALEVAYENEIKYIIDDGLLIYENKIIAGSSAKQEKTIMEAVRRAIFNNNIHKETVKQKIKDENINKILVLGTSNKMVNKIVEKLELGSINKFINIKDISTDEEINIAKECRKNGKHVIPVPTMEIKPTSSGLSINSLKRKFLMRNSKIEQIIEKTIIRPVFSYKGKFFITPNVIEQILFNEINKHEGIEKVNKIDIVNINNSIHIKIKININNIKEIKEIYNLQKKIKYNVERMTSINVKKIDIYINKLKIKEMSKVKK
ncbi:MAG: ATP-binding protein [Peptostreptococcaceae bacterium]